MIIYHTWIQEQIWNLICCRYFNHWTILITILNTSSNLRALMWQVQKQHQVKPEYFELYHFEKTFGIQQKLRPSYNISSRRANCERYTKLKLLQELFLMIIYHTSIQEQISNLLSCKYFNHWTILITILDTSSNLRALMWQVQKQYQANPEYFELYHFEKTFGIQQKLRPSYNINSRRAHWRKIHEP